MATLTERLKSLEEPIRTAVIGIGSIGKGLVHQCHITTGFKPVAIADIDLEKAISCVEWLQLPYDIVESPAELNAALRTGRLAVSRDGELIAAAEDIDVLIEASSAVYAGAMHARAAIEQGHHVVMMNYEAEVMYGPVLLQAARSAGVVYTCADGDQPTAIKQVVDDITLWGFQPVLLGNMKGFHDQYTNPERIAPEADKRNLDHKMCSSYTDGSKLCVEMASLANGLDGRVLRPGMTGPRMQSIHDIFQHFDFGSFWAAGDQPFVDYVLGAKPSGGVFVVGHTSDAFHQFTLDWFPPDMGPGPFYLFYRPYHLGAIEALRCVAEACLDSATRLAPVFGMKTNVFCYAKTDLPAGAMIDGMGGFATYGLIENLDGSTEPGLPQLISDGVRLRRPVRKDERIRLTDCEVAPAADPAFELYREACLIVPGPATVRPTRQPRLAAAPKRQPVTGGAD
jgi:predicted homoserine dehydrogenase-like protein